jgi:hypothetical protein
MPISSPTPSDQEDVFLTVTAYGLKKKSTVRRLVKALASIPCHPLVIFRIDKAGRILGVIDQRERHPGYYVRVRHWGRDPDLLPQIGWSSDPRKMGRGFKNTAERKLLNYVSGVRQEDLTVKYRAKEQDELTQE